MLGKVWNANSVKYCHMFASLVSGSLQQCRVIVYRIYSSIYCICHKFTHVKCILRICTYIPPHTFVLSNCITALLEAVSATVPSLIFISWYSLDSPSTCFLYLPHFKCWYSWGRTEGLTFCTLAGENNARQCVLSYYLVMSLHSVYSNGKFELRRPFKCIASHSQLLQHQLSLSYFKIMVLIVPVTVCHRNHWFPPCFTRWPPAQGLGPITSSLWWPLWWTLACFLGLCQHTLCGEDLQSSAIPVSVITAC